MNTEEQDNQLTANSVKHFIIECLEAASKELRKQGKSSYNTDATVFRLESNRLRVEVE